MKVKTHWWIQALSTAAAVGVAVAGTGVLGKWGTIAGAGLVAATQGGVALKAHYSTPQGKPLAGEE